MRRLGTPLKILVSVGALVYVLWAAHPLQVIGILQRARVGYLLSALALWFLIQLLNVYKWSLLNRAQGFDIPFRRLLEVYYMGMFFNTFLPSGFGGDALRAYELSRLSNQSGSSVSSVAIDRFTSLYALLLVATAARALAPPEWPVMSFSWLLALDMAAGAGFVVLISEDWLQKVGRISVIARRAGAARFLDEMTRSLKALGRSPVAILGTLGLSVVYQFLTVVLHYLLLLSLGLTVTFAYTACFLPLLVLIASLPISINGIGLREGGFVFFLGQVGISSADAVSVGLLSLGMLLSSGVVGASVYAVSSKRAASSPTAGA